MNEMNEIDRTEVHHYFNDFYDAIRNLYLADKAHLARFPCRFLQNFANILPNNGWFDPLSNYTGYLVMDNNWIDTWGGTSNWNFGIIKTNQVTGFVNYFCQTQQNYKIFKFIKRLMTIHTFITQEELNAVFSITENPDGPNGQIHKLVYAYMINSELWSVLELWKNSKINWKNDSQMLSNRIDSIYLTHGIPINWCNKPELHHAMAFTSLDNNNIWRLSFQSTYVSELNHAGYNEVWEMLRDYKTIISYQNTATATTYSPPVKTKEPGGSTKKKKSIPVALKRKVWNKWVGEDIGKTKCLCCKLSEITQMSFNCGHIIAETNGGELKMDNLKPICQSCNSSMGTMNMNEFIEKYGF